MKNENGVTLIALVLMVILMLILTSVGIYTGVDSYKTMKTKKFEAEMTIVQEKVNIIRDEYKSWEYYPAKTCNEYVMEKYSYDEMYEGTMSKNKPAYVGANYGVSSDPTSPYAILSNILDSTKNRVKLEPEDREIGLYNYYYFTAAELEKRFGLTNLDVNVFINFNKGIIIERDGVDAIDVLAIEKRYYILSELQNAQKGGYFVDEAYIDPTDQSVVYTSTAELTSNTTEETKITLKLNRFISISKIEYAVLDDDTIDSSNIPTSSWNQVPSFEYNSTQGIDFQINPNITGVVRIKVTPKNKDAFINSNSIFITKVNNPRYVEGMTRIAWNGSNNRIFELRPADSSIVWYDYSSNEKRWANMMLPDGSMYVWIPRFAYKITTENKIEILFLKDNSNITFDGEQLPEGYIVHPAFRNGQGEESTFMNGEFSSEIPGFWVAKFETLIDRVDNSSSSYYTDINMNEFDYMFRSLPNADLTNNDDSINLYSALKRVRLLETRMRTIGFSNFQNKTQNINNDTFDLDNDSNLTNIDSHLIKNSEWGAIAYLTYSNYGVGLVEGAMPFSTSKYTGGGKNNEEGRPDYTSEDGMKFSTTGNATGIYDLTTGRLEMVACISENSSASFAEDSKYKSNQYLTIYPANENNSVHGDAMNEVSQLITAYSYGGVRQYFTSSKPYLLRGGNSGSKFGLFDYTAVDTESGYAIRPIWVVLK